jgi:hypothetical protein
VDQQDWVDHLELARILLQQFGTLRNRIHPLSNGDGKITNCAHDFGNTRTTPE